jgi:hypothetical protein
VSWSRFETRTYWIQLASTAPLCSLNLLTLRLRKVNYPKALYCLNQVYIHFYLSFQVVVILVTLIWKHWLRAFECMCCVEYVAEGRSNIVVYKITEAECHLYLSPCIFRVINGRRNKWDLKRAWWVCVCGGGGWGVISLYGNGWNLKGKWRRMINRLK